MKPYRMMLLPLLVLGLGACDDDATEPVLEPEPTLVEVAVAVNEETGEFSTLIAALVAADLVDALVGPGPLTVFAPTDAAFAALGLDATSVAALPKEDLTNILLYQVVSGRLRATDVLAVNQLSMLNSGTTTIGLREDVAYINDSAIIQTDVEARNGVIHVIDAVLLP